MNDITGVLNEENGNRLPLPHVSILFIFCQKYYQKTLTSIYDSNKMCLSFNGKWFPIARIGLLAV
jgi:hypothetical protein